MSTRGRKPDAKAIRRAKDGAAVSQAAVVERSAAISKPLSVEMVPGLSALWDTFVGTGIAYKPEDAPLLEQLVFDLELARQCREKCIDDNGNIIPMVGVGEPDENGVYLESKPNPYIKQMREAVSEAMKIADQMGCTPLARARLGLTQAAGKAMSLSVADMIDSALARRK